MDWMMIGVWLSVAVSLMLGLLACGLSWYALRAIVDAENRAVSRTEEVMGGVREEMGGLATALWDGFSSEEYITNLGAVLGEVAFAVTSKKVNSAAAHGDGIGDALDGIGELVGEEQGAKLRGALRMGERFGFFKDGGEKAAEKTAPASGFGR